MQATIGKEFTVLNGDTYSIKEISPDPDTIRGREYYFALVNKINKNGKPGKRIDTYWVSPDLKTVRKDYK